jgi:hypothetical protein
MANLSPALSPMTHWTQGLLPPSHAPLVCVAVGLTVQGVHVHFARGIACDTILLVSKAVVNYQLDLKMDQEPPP